VGLRIEIDRELCMGSGNCGFWAPGVFDLDDDGIAVVLDPAAQPEDKIVLAAQGCPTQAITLVAEDEAEDAGVEEGVEEEDPAA
jgi:ferredoxin